MGNQCTSASCCTTDGEIDAGNITAEGPRSSRVGPPFATPAGGANTLDTPKLDSEMLVKVRATVRGMLARKQYMRLKQNCDPNSYVLVMPDNPDYWFRFEMVNRKDVQRAASPEAQPITIATILEQLGDFVYGD